MRIHHLNCGVDRPLGGALMDGCSVGPFACLVCHCLLIETQNAGLVLVDTGYGLRDVHAPHPRTSRAMRALLNIRFKEKDAAVRQIEALGFAASDVRHILMTHLDFDHAGGLEDFPQARVHLMAEELEAARRRDGGVAGRKRYRPLQIAEVEHWRTYGEGGENWFGFKAVRDLEGLPPEILLVPLRGHTWGHAGVAVQTGAGWLLHAGDAYFHRHEVRRADRRCTPGLRLYQNLMEVDRAARLHNQARLRALSLDQNAGVEMICAHDPVEFRRFAAGRA